MKMKPEKIMVDDEIDTQGYRKLYAVKFKDKAWHIDYRFEPVLACKTTTIEDAYHVFETQYIRNIGGA